MDKSKMSCQAHILWHVHNYESYPNSEIPTNSAAKFEPIIKIGFGMKNRRSSLIREMILSWDILRYIEISKLSYCLDS